VQPTDDEVWQELYQDTDFSVTARMGNSNTVFVTFNNWESSPGVKKYLLKNLL
jgi:hypothetical protein